MSLGKVDESLTILSEINIKQTIKRIKAKFSIDVTGFEVDYYLANHKISPFQTQLVFSFYAKYFGGFRDLTMLSRKQYIKLLILLKRILQIQGKLYLSQILTANIQKLNSRTIQNTKFINKIETSVLYQTIIEEKFNTIEQLKKNNTILNLLSTILNTSFNIVDYDGRDNTGEPLEVNADMVSDEFLDFLNQI